MSNVVSKTNPTRGVLYSVNTPDYPENEYWVNPVLPNCEIKYWRNASGQLREMTITQQKEVDDTEKLRLDDLQYKRFKDERWKKIDETSYMWFMHVQELHLIESGIISQTTLSQEKIIEWVQYWLELWKMDDSPEFDAYNPVYPIEPDL
jgi:hypothetical protein